LKFEKIIGIGNTAVVYEYEEGKVLKLFNEGYPKEAVEREFYNAKAIKKMDFSKPKAHEIIFCEERIGIVYDKARGESLLDWVMKTGNLKECAKYMAKLHRSILSNRISNVPDYKEFLKNNIVNIPTEDLKKREEMLQVIDKLPEGNTLCHGDFHPGNILIQNGQAMVLDFMNICKGSFLYDVARTVFLIEYTPVPKEVTDRERILKFKKMLADLYLMEMNVTREDIRDHLSVIIEARKGECPDENFTTE
jgi:thiamine kinase-like enzyme